MDSKESGVKVFEVTMSLHDSSKVSEEPTTIGSLNTSSELRRALLSAQAMIAQHMDAVDHGHYQDIKGITLTIMERRRELPAG